MNQKRDEFIHARKKKEKRECRPGSSAVVVLRAIFCMSYFSISRHKGSLMDASTSSVLRELQKVTYNFKQKFLITQSHTEHSAGLQGTHRSARHTLGFL